MIPLELRRLKAPHLIVEAIYRGVKQEVDDNESVSYLGEELADDFRRYYQIYTRLLRRPQYFLYLHAQKLETLVQDVLSRSNTDPVRVLDVGCGMGSESIALGLLGVAVFGIDINSRSLQIAQRRCRWYESRLGHKLEVSFACKDAGKLGELCLPVCDIVFAHGSVVFFESVNDFLKATTRTLRPKGSLIVTCVNIAHPFNSIGFFIHTGRLRFRFESHRPLTPRQIRRWFEANGLKVKFARGYGYVPPFVLTRSESICNLILRLERLLPAQLSYLTGLTYLIGGEKLERGRDARLTSETEKQDR